MNLLGSGTYGYVYRSGDEAVKKTYARGNLPSSVIRESDFLLRANHPNIIRCYQTKFLKREVLLRLELAAGDFRSLVPLKKLSFEKAKNLVVDLFRGLHFIHKHGVVHGDIKPGNLLLTEDGSLKICDFGIIEFLGKTEYMYSLSYRPPEVREGISCSGKSDIWAAGCTLFEKMTGRRPSQGDSVIKESFFNRKWKPLYSIINQCLRNDPRERPSAEEILSFLEVEPIEGEMEIFLYPSIPEEPTWIEKRTLAITFFVETVQELGKHPHVWILSIITLDRLVEEVETKRILGRLDWICMSILYLTIRLVHNEHYPTRNLVGDNIDSEKVFYIARDIFGILGCKLYYPNRFTRLYDEIGDDVLDELTGP